MRPKLKLLHFVNPMTLVKPAQPSPGGFEGSPGNRYLSIVETLNPEPLYPEPEIRTLTHCKPEIVSIESPARLSNKQGFELGSRILPICSPRFGLRSNLGSHSKQDWFCFPEAGCEPRALVCGRHVLDPNPRLRKTGYELQ